MSEVKTPKRRVFVFRSEHMSKKEPADTISEKLWSDAEKLKVPVGTRVLVCDHDYGVFARFLLIRNKNSWRRECHLISLLDDPPKYDLEGCWEANKQGLDYGYMVE